MWRNGPAGPVGTLVALLRSGVLFPALRSDGSQPPGAPATGDLTPSSDLYGSLRLATRTYIDTYDLSYRL